MFSFKKQETKSLIAIHGWSSVILGLLLYAVVLTGMVAVLAKEIGHWSTANSDLKVPFSEPVNEIVQNLSKNIGRAYRSDVSISKAINGHLSIYFHKSLKTSSGLNQDRGVRFEVNPKTGEILSRREGTGVHLRNTHEDSTLMRFIIDTHVRLYMPAPWGLLVTGILGLVMMLSAVTGLFIHRHLIRDIFTLRRGGNSVLDQRDRHSVAASWGLPFAFLLALTGCFFSFAFSFGIPALAMVGFGGNQAELVRAISGNEYIRPGYLTKTSNLDVMLADARHRSGAIPVSISIEHFGRKNAKVKINLYPKLGELVSKTYVYKGLDGSFVRELPRIGKVPSMGSQLVDIIGPLHFGSFAGILSKSIWVALGFASCYIIISGLNLWIRRREDKFGWRIFDRLITVFAIGLPLSIAASALGFFMFKESADVVNATPLAFVAASLLSILLALFFNSRQLASILWGLLSLSLLSLPLMRFTMEGIGWLTALEAGAISVIGIDLMLIMIGLAAARTAFQINDRAINTSTQHLVKLM